MKNIRKESRNKDCIISFSEDPVHSYLHVSFKDLNYLTISLYKIKNYSFWDKATKEDTFFINFSAWTDSIICESEDNLIKSSRLVRAKYVKNLDGYILYKRILKLMRKRTFCGKPNLIKIMKNPIVERRLIRVLEAICQKGYGRSIMKQKQIYL